tara:strand:- start:100 stop:645 length:546 start_codon:yes stop_codon:yes gene_type:complete
MTKEITDDIGVVETAGNLSKPRGYAWEVKEFLELCKSVDRDTESFAAITMFDQLEAMYKQDRYIKVDRLQYPKGYVHPNVSLYPTDHNSGLRLDAVTRIQLHIMKEMATRDFDNRIGVERSFIEELAYDIGGRTLDASKYGDNNYLLVSPELFQRCDVLGQWTAGTFNELMEEKRWLWGAK